MFNNKVLLITGGTGSFGELSWIACCLLIFAKSAFSVAIKKQDDMPDIEGMKRLLLKLDFIQKVNRAESALIEA